MKKETADLVDLQELFEMAGPSIFLDDFDVPGFYCIDKKSRWCFNAVPDVIQGLLRFLDYDYVPLYINEMDYWIELLLSCRTRAILFLAIS